MTVFRMPTWASVVLSLLAGLLAALNLTSFGFPPVWQELVTIGLAALAALGIAPATHATLLTMLHVSQAAALALGSLFSTAAVAITTLSISTDLKAVLGGILVALAGMLFGPAGPAAPVRQPPVALGAPA